MISNITNRTDPNSLKSRVFVGNLNTIQMSKAELETIFSKYGPVVAISIHKGYAFIQYTNEVNARAAVMGEDSKSYYNMMLGNFEIADHFDCLSYIHVVDKSLFISKQRFYSYCSILCNEFIFVALLILILTVH